jgi:hypothetical protein
MRFALARSAPVYGVCDGGLMSWRATDLAEDDARQHAADLNVTFNQSGNATKPIAEKSARRSKWNQPHGPQQAISTTG